MVQSISREEIIRTFKERPEIEKLMKLIKAQPEDRQAEFALIALKYIESRTNTKTAEK